MDHMSPATFLRENDYFPCCFAAEAVVEHIAATPGHPPPSSSSVTSQPTPRTDLFPTSTTEYSCSSPADSPASPPETEELKPPPAEDEEETQGPSQPKHRTLLDIDRFTLCGNRID